MNAILLAAGRGRKFWPFADARNKCAFPLGDRPIVRRLAEQLLGAGIAGIAVVVGEHAGSVRAALQGLEDRLTFVEQPRPDGTAAAALLGWEALGDGSCVLAYGDVVASDAAVAAAVAAAREGAAPAAAAVVPLGPERPGDWITVDCAGGALTAFEGHGRDGTHRLCGLFALSSAALPYLRANPGLMTHVPVGGMPALEADVAESLARMADDGLEVRALQAPGPFVDLDKPWHILEARRAWLAERFDGAPELRIADGGRVAESAEVGGRLILEPGAVVGERVVAQGDLWVAAGAEITNGAIVGPNCFVGPRARVRDYALVTGDSMLGPDSLCGHGAEFAGVLLEGAYLYHYCEISGVVGARVDIGAATVCGTLRFDDGEAPQRIAGRREAPREGANAAYLGDYSRTGVNAILMPGVKVGAWSCVGPGVVLNEDLPSRQAVFVRQALERRPWGPERYGW
jgi:NDP-sugar pyrophosphorylase family protein